MGIVNSIYSERQFHYLNIIYVYEISEELSNSMSNMEPDVHDYWGWHTFEQIGQPPLRNYLMKTMEMMLTNHSDIFNIEYMRKLFKY